MRTNAKRPTAGSNQGGGESSGRIFRGSFATRGASAEAGGSGAPSRRARHGLLALAATLLAGLLLAPSAFAGKELVDYFGTAVFKFEENGSGSEGGEFDLPRGIAVNSTGAGPADAGDIYVAETFNNRVQRFDSEGNFISAWGADVSLPDGGTGYEVCTVAAQCQAAAGSGGNGTAAGNGTLSSPEGIEVDLDSGNVYVSDRGNRRVNVYDGAGSFLFSFGRDVQEPNGGTVLEICDDATDVCRQGDVGSGPGEIGSALASGIFRLALTPPDGNPATGTLFLADTGNRRVNTYALDGTSPASFGSSSVFASEEPRSIAVDSRGIVYASNNVNGSQVERYDTEDANGGGVGFLAPITAENSTPAGPLLTGAARATENLAVDPDSDGAGPDTDVLQVVRNPSASEAPTVVQQLGSVNAPGLATPPAATDDTHGTGLGLSGFSAFGLDPAGGRLFLGTTSVFRDFNIGQAVYVLDDPLPPPTATLQETDEKSGDNATLTATVDPGGGPVAPCEFEYTTDPSNPESWVHLPATSECLSLEPGGGPQPVSKQLTGLVPETKYYVRFHVSRLLVVESTVLTPHKFFTTDAVPPIVTDAGSLQITNASARLVATIDPRNSETAYVFQYGTTPSLGSSTAPLAIGGGATPITVSQVVDGLKPDTTYYFRAVATNLNGTTEGTSGSFRTRAAPPQPTNRRYEMVSPPEKNYTDADNVTALLLNSTVGSSPDGNSVAYCTTALFGEPPSQQTSLCAPYIAKRTASGWQTDHPFPKFCKVDNHSGGFSTTQHITISPDWSRFVVHQPDSELCEHPPLDPSAPLRDDPLGSPWNLYLEDPGTEPFDYRLLNTAVPDNFQVVQNKYAGGDDDFSHVVYTTSANQTSPPDSPAPSDIQKVYLRVEQGEDGCAQPDGCLSLLSKDPGGEPFATDSGVPVSQEIYGGERTMTGAVSRDGERIYFQNPIGPSSNLIWGHPTCDTGDPECDLYVREGGTDTVEVSVSECTLGEACGSDDDDRDIFLYATPSGRHAFFHSASRLTDASSPEAGDTNDKIYRWDAEAPPGNRLVDLTVDEGPSDGAQSGFNPPDNGGFLGASDDGNTAFFVVNGQLVAGEDTSPASGALHKLYRWRWNGGEPTVDYLGPYSDVTSFGIYDHNASGLRRMVTPDGRYLMLYSGRRLDPAIDRDTDRDVYRWGEEKGWECASCQQPGTPSGGHVATEDVVLWGFEVPFPSLSNFEPRTLISDDGQRIFFATPDPLVPEDTNGLAACPIDPGVPQSQESNVHTCDDVYEWHDGVVRLVSDGASAYPARLINATTDGSDVFFYSREQLVGWDKDANIDIYDARVGGGFPEPAPQPPECEGEGCRGEGSSAPAVAGAGSAVFQGAGNPKTEAAGNRCPANRLRRGKRCLTLRAIARKRCRRLSGAAKRRCVNKQTRRLRRAQRRRAQRRVRLHRANLDRRAAR